MSAPTEANLRTQWKDAAAALEHLRKAFAVNSPNYVTDEDQLAADLGNYGNDFQTPLLAAMSVLRGRLNAALLDAPNVLLPILRQYGALIAAPESDGVSLCARLYDYFRTNSYTVQSRQMSFGSPSAGGSNTGTGVLYRLTKDAYNFPIEAQHADAKVVQCIADGSSGANAHEELFEFRGAAAYKDQLKITGSGSPFNKQYNARSARNSLLSNPSFEACTVASTVFVTAMTGWTSSVAIIGDGTDYQLDFTNYYRSYPGQTAPAALRMYLARTLSQPLAVRNTRIDANRPYYLQIAWNASVGGFTGTLTITMGSLTVAVTIVAQAGWQILKIPVNYQTWYTNWAQAITSTAPAITIVTTKTSGAGTYLLVDDADFVPMDPFDGGWYTIIGGATPFLRLDQFTFSDSEVGSVLQTWLWRAFGRYLPSALPSPSTTIAVALAAAGAGNVENGAHTYAFTVVDGNGLESGVSGTAVATVVDKTTNGKVSVSAIAVGPAGTASRKVYRSAAGTTTPLKLLTTIADNATTTYTDNTADASLGANSPSAVTITDPT